MLLSYQLGPLQYIMSLKWILFWSHGGSNCANKNIHAKRIEHHNHNLISQNCKTFVKCNLDLAKCDRKCMNSDQSKIELPQLFSSLIYLIILFLKAGTIITKNKGRRSSMVTHWVAVVRIRVQILKWKLEFLRHNMFTQYPLGCVRRVIIG